MNLVRVDEDTNPLILEAMEEIMKHNKIRPAGIEEPFLYIQDEAEDIQGAAYLGYDGVAIGSFSFAVEPEVQSQGLGRQMFEEILTEFATDDDNIFDGRKLEIISTHPATTTLCRDAGARVEWENDKSTKFTLTVNQIKKHQKHRKRLAELITKVHNK